MGWSPVHPSQLESSRRRLEAQGAAGGAGPKALPTPACGTRDRARPSSPADILGPLRRGGEARAARTQGWPLPSFPSPPPGPSPGRRLGRARQRLRDGPGPSPRPEIPRGSQRRSNPADSQASVASGGPHHPVTGLRSVTTTAAALFLRFLGDPPTFLLTNEKRGRLETALRGPVQSFSRRKANLCFGN